MHGAAWRGACRLPTSAVRVSLRGSSKLRRVSELRRCNRLCMSLPLFDARARHGHKEDDCQRVGMSRFVRAGPVLQVAEPEVEEGDAKGGYRTAATTTRSAMAGVMPSGSYPSTRGRHGCRN
eukprot:1195578-Prorocentrum_minimum.AAC.3